MARREVVRRGEGADAGRVGGEGPALGEKVGGGGGSRGERGGEGERIDVLGEVAVVKVSAAESGGSVSVVEVVSRAGGGAPAHWHTTFEETFYVLEGRLEVVVWGIGRTGGAEERRTVLGPGDSVMIPRGVVHSYTNVGEGPGRAVVVATPGGIEGMFREFERLAREGAGFEELREAGRRWGTELVPPGR